MASENTPASYYEVEYNVSGFLNCMYIYQKKFAKFVK